MTTRQRGGLAILVLLILLVMEWGGSQQMSLLEAFRAIVYLIAGVLLFVLPDRGHDAPS